MNQKIKHYHLFYILLIIFLLIKYSKTQYDLKESKDVTEITTFIPIKYLPEEEKKKIQDEEDDIVYISGGQTLTSFTNFYDQLTTPEKKIYQAVLSATKESTPKFEVTVTYDDTKNKLNKTDFGSQLGTNSANAFSVLINDHPELWWIGTYSYSYYYYKNFMHKITYNLKLKNTSYNYFSTENIMNLNRKLDMEKIDIMKKITDLNLTTHYAILRYIHDYLIVKNTYLLDNSRTHIRNIYGSMIENRCVCEGYAEAFQYLAQQFNIECIIARSSSHEWNLVKMDNNWYIVDITWDDPESNPTGYGYDKKVKTDYFLAGTTFVENNDKNNEHKLVYSYYKGYNSFDYPQISDDFYTPNTEETAEVNYMINSFASSYLSLTTCNFYYF